MVDRDDRDDRADRATFSSEPESFKELRRTLYGLHAILQLHFDQEEELYLFLQDG